MRRILLSLIVAGGLALMAAPDAGAVSACSTMAGKNYAILLSGSEYFNVAGGEPGSLTPVRIRFRVSAR